MITEALVNSHPGAPFEYREVKLEDSIRGYEVLVEIKATSVCHTGTIRTSNGNQ
jgi:Zn-dependent alcohol dehydrogenase